MPPLALEVKGGLHSTDLALIDLAMVSAYTSALNDDLELREIDISINSQNIGMPFLGYIWIRRKPKYFDADRPKTHKNAVLPVGNIGYLHLNATIKQDSFLEEIKKMPKSVNVLHVTDRRWLQEMYGKIDDRAHFVKSLRKEKDPLVKEAIKFKIEKMERMLLRWQYGIKTWGIAVKGGDFITDLLAFGL
jgi:hypothetical protein